MILGLLKMPHKHMEQFVVEKELVILAMQLDLVFIREKFLEHLEMQELLQQTMMIWQKK